MTTSPASPDLIPEWTLGDRLRKARQLTGLGVREFADRIGVSHGTITNAETDARTVRPITLKAYASETGVSLDWLLTGDAGAPTPPRPTGTRPTPARRSDDLAALTERKKSRTRGMGANRRYAVLADAA